MLNIRIVKQSILTSLIGLYCGYLTKAHSVYISDFTTSRLDKFNFIYIFFAGFGKFFSLDGVMQKEVIKDVIERLEEILKWFNKQRTYNFFASSILIVFDGDVSISSSKTSSSSSDLKVADDCCNGDTDSIIENDYSELISKDSEDSKKFSPSESVHPKVQVRMIDFAHVYRIPDEDDNYIFGLKHLIYDLHRLLKS